MHGKQMGLLEQLANRMGLLYLSDLRLARHPIAIVRQLDMLGENDYTLLEWTEAANYLLNTHDSFSSCAECRLYLSDALLLANQDKPE